MVISQPFVIQPEELPVWIRDICSYHSAAGSHKRAETRRYFSAGARGSAARILIDSSRIRAPTPTILIYLTSVNHFRSNDVKNSPLLTVVFDIEIHATLIVGIGSPHQFFPRFSSQSRSLPCRLHRFFGNP